MTNKNISTTDYEAKIRFLGANLFLPFTDTTGSIAKSFIENLSTDQVVIESSIAFYGTAASKPLIAGVLNPFGGSNAVYLNGGTNSNVFSYVNSSGKYTDLKNDCTISVWFATTQPFNDEKVICAFDSGADFKITKDTSGNIVLSFRGQSYTYTPPVAFADKEWHNVVFINRNTIGSSSTVILDGEIIISLPVVAVVQSSIIVSVLLFGSVASGIGSQMFLAYPALWNRAINFREAAQAFYDDFPNYLTTVTKTGIPGYLFDKIVPADSSITITTINDQLNIHANVPPGVIQSANAAAGSGLTAFIDSNNILQIGTIGGTPAGSIYKTVTDSGDTDPAYLSEKVLAAPGGRVSVSNNPIAGGPSGSRALYIDVDLTTVFGSSDFTDSMWNFLDNNGNGLPLVSPLVHNGQLPLTIGKVSVDSSDMLYPGNLVTKIVGDGQYIFVNPIGTGSTRQLQIGFNTNSSFAPLVGGTVPLENMDPSLKRNVFKNSDSLANSVLLNFASENNPAVHFQEANVGDIFRSETTHQTYVLKHGGMQNVSNWLEITAKISPSDVQQLTSGSDVNITTAVGNVLQWGINPTTLANSWVPKPLTITQSTSVSTGTDLVGQLYESDGAGAIRKAGAGDEGVNTNFCDVVYWENGGNNTPSTGTWQNKSIGSVLMDNVNGSGSVVASPITLNGITLNVPTITSAIINSSTINSATINSSNLNFPVLNTAQINGGFISGTITMVGAATITGGTITGGTISNTTITGTMGGVSPADGESLVWSSGSNKWLPAAGSSAGSIYFQFGTNLAQTIFTSQTFVTGLFTSEVSSPSPFNNTTMNSTGHITCLRTGRYAFNFSGQIATTNIDRSAHVVIRNITQGTQYNGALVQLGTSNQGGFSVTGQSGLCDIINLNSGDVLSIEKVASSGNCRLDSLRGYFVSVD